MKWLKRILGTEEEAQPALREKPMSVCSDCKHHLTNIWDQHLCRSKKAKEASMSMRNSPLDCVSGTILCKNANPTGDCSFWERWER